MIFQSTRPVRGGTIISILCLRIPLISIHPPRAGRDPILVKMSLLRKISIHPPRAGRDGQPSQLLPQRPNFNPPAPCGAGLCGIWHEVFAAEFQSTRPVRGGTRYTVFAQGTFTHFNPPAPCGAGQPKTAVTTSPRISIHPPRAGRDNGRDATKWEIWHFKPPAPCGAGLRLFRASWTRK